MHSASMHTVFRFVPRVHKTNRTAVLVGRETRELDDPASHHVSCGKVASQACGVRQIFFGAHVAGIWRQYARRRCACCFLVV